MEPRDAYEITSMLRGVVDYGTGRAVREAGITGPVAGKTGTTNNGADVWFVGYTPTLIAGVWFGYDTPRQIAGNATGGRLAAPAWADIYADGWHERRGDDWIAPDGMVSRVIDPESGELATDWCPHRTQEWFKPGTEPVLPCDLHTEPSEPMADAGDMGRRGEDVFQSLGRSIGKTLRRIFKF
jgi:membrane carboxypeptidase/penicillin-binding protein